MKLGIQYHESLSKNAAREAGFSYLEMPYDFGGIQKDFQVSGVVLNIREVTEPIFLNAIQWVEKGNAEYLLIDTQDVFDDTVFRVVIESTAEIIRESSIRIYIENGFIKREGEYYGCAFSEARQLKQMVEDYNKICKKDCFATALNVGYANLIGKNLRDMVDELGDTLKLLHSNDNDGKENLHQMPYTFATGRGTLPSTDWYRVMGRLIKNHFDGWIVFDVSGLVARTPERLQQSMFTLLHTIATTWMKEFTITQRLNQPEKQLILFGAGKMVKNYLESWGEDYPPAFLVDNNSKIWGEERLGYIVKSPQSILEIPENERNVWICNQYYDPIGEQLTKMGISYECYWDHYYL